MPAAAAANGPQRVLILGAAGRDYHTFNTRFRDDPNVQVVGFTHAQIPHIESSRYPPELSGALYPDGLPIWPEAQLEAVIAEQRVDSAVLAYSDISYASIAALSARVRSAGASLLLLGGRDGMLSSSKPVVAVTAVRTGCGKSQVCRLVIDAARQLGKRVVLVRHPMPYGELAKQAVQRFESLSDLDRHHTTVEEREEYEQHIRNGVVVYAGVDYAAILAQAQEEADVVLWDGGNNDTPFYQPDVWICVADPLRPGHESEYYPGDANFRCADAIVVSKANTAPQAGVEAVIASAQQLNPRAKIYVTASEVYVDLPELVEGKQVLCVDDGPTITHGGMAAGAALIAATKYGAAGVCDPRPFFVGELAATLAKYPHIGPVVPAMGYSEQQLKDLAATIAAVPCDAVLLGTPHDLTRLISVSQPVVSVTYVIEDVAEGVMAGLGAAGSAVALASATALKESLVEFLKQRVSK